MTEWEQRSKKAEEIYQRKVAGYEKTFDRQHCFLEENDRRLEALREKNDRLHPERKKQLEKHRKRVDRIRKEHEKRVRTLFTEAEIRERNRLKKRKQDKKNRLMKKKILLITIGGGTALFLFILFESIIPGSRANQAAVMDENIEESALDAELVPTKPYDELLGTTEEQLLWDSLMVHFGGNKKAVLGVMCNLHAESGFEAANLEDSNNERWDVTDDLYTEFVNRQSINKKDFLEARIKDDTTGYLTADNQWVNLDGGYGYAQFTSYEKKEGLYQYAEQWFAPGGVGEQYRFNIGDPKMQASFIIRILESDEYREMNDLIAHAENTVDACYYWLKMYEEPYDPYCDGYYTLAFERAETADIIEALCDPAAAQTTQAG